MKGWVKDIFWYAPRNFFQKVFSTYHLSGPEVWNLDHTLALQIVRHLKAFKNGPFSGHPVAFMSWEEVEKNWGSAVKEEDKSKYLGGGVEGWKDTVDEMIFGFEFHIYGEEIPEYVKDPKAKEFLKKYGTVWTETGYDKEKLKAMNDRAIKGRELFTQHFGSLWD